MSNIDDAKQTSAEPAPRLAPMQPEQFTDEVRAFFKALDRRHVQGSRQEPAVDDVCAPSAPRVRVLAVQRSPVLDQHATRKAAPDPDHADRYLQGHL
jgi:hypothetical protein